MEAFQRSTQPAVRVAAKVTVTQMLGSSSLTSGSTDMQKQGDGEVSLSLKKSCFVCSLQPSF